MSPVGYPARGEGCSVVVQRPNQGGRGVPEECSGEGMLVGRRVCVSQPGETSSNQSVKCPSATENSVA